MLSVIFQICRFYLLSLEYQIIFHILKIVVACDEQIISNGQISYDKGKPGGNRLPRGTIATFSCDSGYSLSGSSISICDCSGNWILEFPVCSREGYECKLAHGENHLQER